MTDRSPPSETDRAALLDAATAALGLAVAPEWRTDVLMHMGFLADAARRLEDFPLDETIEPAPVFVPR